MGSRYVIVTGANKGLGRAVAMGLATSGAAILLACRDAERGSSAAREIAASSGNPDVRHAILDLASVRSVSRFAEERIREGRPIDALVNNAGALPPRYASSPDELELTVHTNYVGLFQLTTSLAPLLRDGTGRILAVSSVMYRLGRVDDGLFRRPPEAYDKFRAYADSKLAALLFCLELGDRLAGRGVRVSSIDPGIVDTGILRMHSLIDPLTDLLFRPFVRSPEEAAYLLVRLASGERAGASLEPYYVRRRERRLGARFLMHPERSALWDRTAELIASVSRRLGGAGS